MKEKKENQMQKKGYAATYRSARVWVVERNDDLNVIMGYDLLDSGLPTHWQIAVVGTGGYLINKHLGSESYIKRVWRSRYKGKKPGRIVRKGIIEAHDGVQIPITKPWPHV